MSNRSALLHLVRQLNESQLLGLVADLDRRSLEVLQVELGLNDCDCETEFAPCTCEDSRIYGECDCVITFDRVILCPHQLEALRRPPLLPYSVQTALLENLYPDKYREPPPPPEYSAVMLRQAMAVVMARRAEQGYGLRHKTGDWLRRRRGTEYDPVEDRLGRPVARARNGSDLPGRLGLFSGDQPPAAPEPLLGPCNPTKPKHTIAMTKTCACADCADPVPSPPKPRKAA